jgi:hypothetical protein
MQATYGFSIPPIDQGFSQYIQYTRNEFTYDTNNTLKTLRVWLKKFLVKLEITLYLG